MRPTAEQTRERRHERLYYANGDDVLSTSKVKLAAEDETAVTETTFFRVDSTFLIRQTKMLGINKPHAQYDGVPHLQIPADARDLAQLLGALHDMSTLNLQPYDPDMPLEILGVLKLASQYSVPSVCMAILRCLSEAWPHTLDDWDDQRDQVDRVAARCARAGTGGRLRGKFLDQMFPEPAAALHLAAECSIRKIVPVALYQLALVDPEDRWGYADETHLRACGRTARWELLDATTLLHVERGRLELMGLRRAQLKIPMTPARDCSRHECKAFLNNPSQFKSDDLDYLHRLRLLEDTAADTLCSKCRPRTISAIKNHRRTFWKELPVFFDLVPRSP